MALHERGRIIVALRKESVDRNKSTIINCNSNFTSLSARRAWIEIYECWTALNHLLRSLSARRAWIEIPAGCWRDSRRASLSARRAWIEICYLDNIEITQAVALRKESVDRNSTYVTRLPRCQVVALRKESVDRNRNSQYSYFLFYGVALRKESVDRNKWIKNKYIGCRLSLSARRAWIEIAKSTPEEAKR